MNGFAKKSLNIRIETMRKLTLFILLYLLSNIAIAADPAIWTSKVSRDYYYIGGDRISLGVIQFNARNWRTHNPESVRAYFSYCN